jgi:hypothetical protein
MVKSQKKQRAEAAAKEAAAQMAAAARAKSALAAAVAAEVTRAAEAAAAEQVAAADRKARSVTPKTVRVKKMRHVRPARGTATTVRPASGRSSAAGKMLGHSVSQTMAKPGETGPKGRAALPAAGPGSGAPAAAHVSSRQGRQESESKRP